MDMKTNYMNKWMLFFITIAGLAMALVSCGQTKFSDAYAYCKAVGAIDAPDERYNGPQMPEAVLKGIQKAGGIAEDAPTGGYYWRCMKSMVYGCYVGANLPCTSKAAVDKKPTDEMNKFCKSNRNSKIIPMYVTGHETVYAWRCKGDSPEIEKQVDTMDERGYISRIWYELAP
jgi:hypothetical protein